MRQYLKPGMEIWKCLAKQSGDSESEVEWDFVACGYPLQQFQECEEFSQYWPDQLEK